MTYWDYWRNPRVSGTTGTAVVKCHKKRTQLRKYCAFGTDSATAVAIRDSPQNCSRQSFLPRLFLAHIPLPLNSSHTHTPVICRTASTWWQSPGDRTPIHSGARRASRKDAAQRPASGPCAQLCTEALVDHRSRRSRRHCEKGAGVSVPQRATVTSPRLSGHGAFFGTQRALELHPLPPAPPHLLHPRCRLTPRSPPHYLIKS